MMKLHAARADAPQNPIYDEPTMAAFTKYLNVTAAVTCLVGCFSTLASGAEPINRMGRLFGAGWSDGYHACRDSGIRPGADLPPRSFAEQFGCQSCAGNEFLAGAVGRVKSGNFYDTFDHAACDSYGSSSCDGPSCDGPACDGPACDGPACDGCDSAGCAGGCDLPGNTAMAFGSPAYRPQSVISSGAMPYTPSSQIPHTPAMPYTPSSQIPHTPSTSPAMPQAPSTIPAVPTMVLPEVSSAVPSGPVLSAPATAASAPMAFAPVMSTASATIPLQSRMQLASDRLKKQITRGPVRALTPSAVQPVEPPGPLAWKPAKVPTSVFNKSSSDVSVAQVVPTASTFDQPAAVQRNRFMVDAAAKQTSGLKLPGLTLPTAKQLFSPKSNANDESLFASGVPAGAQGPAGVQRNGHPRALSPPASQAALQAETGNGPRVSTVPDWKFIRQPL